ncbi:hypothetical protein EV182_002663 [Spiromyces aspiralis]|uniref:Uncharacterized protein n=1 Tax=Spiromyces aspiralis TaxID=68401 RepID=A0ACC1HLF2_9FUNG|nr:hypothetical protein EV182_002663 [Spiromyces aspiralis]
MALSRPLSSSQGSAGRRSTDSNRGIVEARVTGSEVEVASNDWPKCIKQNLLLVDKSFILPRIIKKGDPILLIRPRRSGKTMCLSMSEDFFGVPRGETRKKKQARYREMIVGADPKFIDEHCGRYPVIRLDLKANLFEVLYRLLMRFPEIDVDFSKKYKSENRIRIMSDLQEELHEKRKLMKTKITSCTKVLTSLVLFLNAYYHKQCILLIDELDAPILAASEDNRDAIREHIRKMLSPLVKSGEAGGLLSKCFMVGVNPISLGELGSGLNNVKPIPLHYASKASYTDDPLKLGNMIYQIAFGFTEDEVRELIATRVFPDNEEMVDIALNVARKWYDGYYVFKNFRIYNPWSVMNFIESLTEGEACSNEAEVLAKARPYWREGGDTKLLKQMYDKITSINPSISRVILWMCLDYFNLKDGTEPSDSPQTSVKVKLVDKFDYLHLTQRTTPYFDEQTKEIEVVIAKFNWDAVTENPSLNKFMSMAYYYGYLTMIREEHLAIPNQEMLEFWVRLIADKSETSDELPLLVEESRILTRSLVSEDLTGFCDAIQQHFLDPLTKVDSGTRECFYHEILFIQLRLGINISHYNCVSEFSTAGGRTDICMIPKTKGRLGVLIELKRTNKDGVMGRGRSSQGAEELLQPTAHLSLTGQEPQEPQQASSSLPAGSGGTADDSTVDVSKAPYCHLKECLREGLEQVEKNHYLRAFYGHCNKVLVVVIAFCGRKYLVSFKYYDCDGPKSTPSANQPSDTHKFCLLPHAVMASAECSNEDSGKKTKGRGKRGRGSRR